MIVDVFHAVLDSIQSEADDIAHIENIKQNENTIRREVGLEILEALRFPAIKERFEEVDEAHKRTFEWIFQSAGDGNPGDTVNSDSAKRWSGFPEWLSSGSGLYWVNGKAASGKSTLMKHVFMHSNTHYHLENWATAAFSHRPLYIVSFFFWLSGTKEQKSQRGLLRSLLYDILRRNLRLLPLVFPQRWSLKYLSRVNISKESSLVSETVALFWNKELTNHTVTVRC